MRNLYESIHAIDPHKVVVILDGDDWFKNNHVLQKLADTYSDEKIWMTYGNYQTWPQDLGSTCATIPNKVRKERSFRSYKWVSSHLRTFYAKLFHKIKIEDFQWHGQEFFPMTYDLAIMFPLLEMASKNHYVFIPDILYVYNVNNPINDSKVNLQLQETIERHIRSLPSYKPLRRLF